jgi:hypothetical protein
MAMEFAGDENTNKKTRFRFWCEDSKCKGNKYFYLIWADPPKLVPDKVNCPYGGDHESEWCVDKVASVHVRGNFDDGSVNPHYTTALAEAEHKWMGMQIEEAQKAVDGQDQIDGTAASPYSTVKPNIDKQLEMGLIKRDDVGTSEQKERIRKERAKLVAEDASDKIDREIEQRHIGNRHDG